ncbi:MAG: 2-amino-4-hydroxy-6-hydroxymethyldihydropteridine diphosphokinase [Ardenticatenales bacterium]|nr:2-amino-4-hydroxy-6-hydroxymethyldihydropteridine diphosphokinase [Ardenticatenales bacterium]
MAYVFISLGSNMDKEQMIPAALDLLREHCILLAVSDLYETLPVGSLDQHTFYNGAALVETSLTAHALKHQVLRLIEQQLGRIRPSDPTVPHPIDLDIVLYGESIDELDGRPIPHPDIVKYGYVAIPLAELAPAYIHPVTHQSLSEIASGFKESNGILRRIPFRFPSERA